MEKLRDVPESFSRDTLWPPLPYELKELSWPKLHFLKKELKKFNELYPDDAELHMIPFILKTIENEVKRRKSK